MKRRYYQKYDIVMLVMTPTEIYSYCLLKYNKNLSDSKYEVWDYMSLTPGLSNFGCFSKNGQFLTAGREPGGIRRIHIKENEQN